MLNDILAAANRYAEGFEHVRKRRNDWFLRHIDIKNHLMEIADTLNKNATYKQGFFVDTAHAYNEETDGTCSDIPSLTLRSGDMPMLVAFTNEKKECKEYLEHGFQIVFNPVMTGEVVVLLQPHYNELDTKKPQTIFLAMLNDPGKITMDDIDAIITRGITTAFSTSFTGIAEQDQQNIPQHTPIGFKRYETTETAAQ